MNAPEPKWERRVDAALGAASAAILFAMMLLTFADVVARYLFDFPLRGAFEVTELMLLVLIFAGLPLVSHADENVTMDFIDHMLPEPALRVLERAVHALCAAVFFFLAWLIWLKAGKIAAYGDTTDVMKILGRALRLLHDGGDRPDRRSAPDQGIHPAEAARAAGHPLTGHD